MATTGIWTEQGQYRARQRSLTGIPVPGAKTARGSELGSHAGLALYGCSCPPLTEQSLQVAERLPAAREWPAAADAAAGYSGALSVQRRSAPCPACTALAALTPWSADRHIVLESCPKISFCRVKWPSVHEL